MTWYVLITDEYERWFLNLTDAEQIDIQAMVEVLEIKGPNLSPPLCRYRQRDQGGQESEGAGHSACWQAI